uniref:Uncharacterized protein n=1 Tax=Tetraselmis chuii TaxID=63592 RepID=A0A7S1T0T2_9CHLO|mmetsp:Transcript_38334/g.68739  ORF Transcript_38334/g.68739 Transcript_38334/m.68739 type:complete len:134 (+) Transcript_38334:172-573(+)
MDAAGSASALARLEARVTAQWDEMEELRAKLAETTEELQSEQQQAAATAEVRALLASALDCAEEEWEARLRVVEGASEVLRSRMELAVGQLREERLRPFLEPPSDAGHGGNGGGNGASAQRGQWVRSVESPII